MKTKHFINLTNGIEAIPFLQGQGIDFDFIRIQSTTIERRNWNKLISDLDHNFLLMLALGYECKVYDYGTNRKMSKTIYLGLPLIEYILNRFWYGYTMPAIRYSRTGEQILDMKDQYDFIYNQLFVFDQDKQKGLLRKKLSYYKRFLNDSQVHLDGLSESTDKDGNYAFYIEIVKNMAKG